MHAVVAFTFGVDSKQTPDHCFGVNQRLVLWSEPEFENVLRKLRLTAKHILIFLHSHGFNYWTVREILIHQRSQFTAVAGNIYYSAV